MDGAPVSSAIGLMISSRKFSRRLLAWAAFLFIGPLVAQESGKTAKPFEVDGTTYAWEVHDEGIDNVLDNLTELAGANAIYLVSVMHKEHRPFQSPEFLHNPKRTHWDTEDARVYFHPDMSLYGRIKPVTPGQDWLKEKDWLKVVVDAAHARGMKAGAEVSHSFMPHETLDENPELRQRDIDGKATGGPCPNNPDVREYLLALFGDLARNRNVDFIQSCIYFFSPGNPEKGGTCFCESCQEAAKAQGFDLKAAIPILRDNPNAQPQLDQWLEFRRRSLTRIYQLIAERIHKENPAIEFRLNEIYPFVRVNNRSAGLYLEDLREVIDSCVIQEHTEQTGRSSNLRKSWLMTDRSLLGPDMPILAGVPTRLKSTPELIAAAIRTSLELGVSGIAIKHYDGSPFSLLRAVRNSLAKEGVKGHTEIKGLEAEDMALTGFAPETYLNEKGIKTSNTGSAIGKFPYPSGTYEIVVSHADDKEGTGEIALWTGGRQAGGWKLDTDKGVWKRKSLGKVEIEEGSEIRLEATTDGGAARIDFIEFHPVKP